MTARFASARLVAGALCMAVLAACGSSSSSSSSGGAGGSASGGGGASSAGSSSAGTTATSVSSIAAEVPQAIRSKGKLVVAADATYAPNEFIGPDGKTVQGTDADLAKALGQVLGLDVEVQNITFDSIIPGLSGGKFDLGLSSFTDTKDREKTVDFVTYFTAGTSFYVKASGGPTITGLGDLCGHKVTVEKGTTQADDANAQDGKCKSAGKSGVEVQVYPDQNGANAALLSGRAEVGMADSPVADYQVKQSNGQFKISGQPYGTAPYGIAIPKGSGMAKPILDALQALIQSGVYKAILTAWGVADGAITNPVINGAQS